MRQVEQHIIRRNDARYAVIDEAAFKAKNLYNVANYEKRQSYADKSRKMLTASELYFLIKERPEYVALPRKVSSAILQQLDKAWKSFFKADKAYKANPKAFLGRPRLPGYKGEKGRNGERVDGRFLLVYDVQALSAPALRSGVIKPSGLAITVPTRHTNADQVRIVPRHGYYVVEVVYTRTEEQAEVDQGIYVAIDVGVDNLAVITTNKPGVVPLIINGRMLKSINQYYNKEYARLQEALAKDKGRPRKVVWKRNKETGKEEMHEGGIDYRSRKLEKLALDRNNKIMHYLHAASKQIIEWMVREGIGTLVIGKNVGWKQEVAIGHKNNQKFVQIPHAKFINLLTYKAQLIGIRVLVTEESYTSQASFLDGDAIPTYREENEEKHRFSGRRIKRGLYRTRDGKLINADVNGSLNILRKVAPDAANDPGVMAGVLNPERFVVRY